MKERPIKYCYWVTDQLLAGEYPRSKNGPDEFEKLDALLAEGVTLFVDLTEQGELLPYANRIDPDQHQRFGIPDTSTPKCADQTTDILNTIDDHLGNGGKVYLHCWGGIGRTGTIIGCWLTRHNGYDGEAALKQLRELWQENPKSAWSESPENEWQRGYVRNWRE